MINKAFEVVVNLCCQPYPPSALDSSCKKQTKDVETINKRQKNERTVQLQSPSKLDTRIDTLNLLSFGIRYQSCPPWAIGNSYKSQVKV